MSVGRPSSYTPEIADSICERLANGESLKRICEDEDMPPRKTVAGWVIDDREGFSARYTHARNLGLDQMADELIEIADETSRDTIVTEQGDKADSEWINRSRLRVDARKWYLSKLAPKTYGDKITNQHTGADGGPIRASVTIEDYDRDNRRPDGTIAD